MLKRALSMDPAAFVETQRMPASLGAARLALALDRHRTATVDMDELQHRMKNMMAVIQSMSRQTMINCATKEQFDQQFSARLSSYCKSIDRLIANDWQGLEIHDLIRTQLTAFVDGMQVSAEGPDLRMSTKGAHSIGLAIHELATNAVKYGSLSVPQGRVLIAWAVLKTGSGDRFHLLWKEIDGPTVTPPTRRGFGRRLIQEVSAAALSGQTTYEFHPKGVTWSLDAPATIALVQSTGVT